MFIYPDEVKRQIERINKKRQSIMEKPKNDINAYKMYMLLSQEAELRVFTITQMINEGIADHEDRRVKKEYLFWANKLFWSLDGIKKKMPSISNKDSEAVLIDLNEWDYLLNWIINSDN
jgi:hypothetical protein